MAWRPITDRDPHAGPVGVYKNLNARDPKAQWSVRALAGPHKGLKVAEGEPLAVRDAAGYVRASTRARILSGSAEQGPGHKGHREVHAWITGWLLETSPSWPRRIGSLITRSSAANSFTRPPGRLSPAPRSPCSASTPRCTSRKNHQLQVRRAEQRMSLRR